MGFVTYYCITIEVVTNYLYMVHKVIKHAIKTLGFSIIRNEAGSRFTLLSNILHQFIVEKFDV